MLVASLMASTMTPCWAQTPTPALSDSTPARSTQDCIADGREAGRKHSTTGAFVVGVVSGFGLGLVGTGIAVATQKQARPPDAVMSRVVGGDCRAEFEEAYSKQGQKKKRIATLFGGLLGTGVAVALILSLQN